MNFVNEKLDEFNTYLKGRKVAIIGLGVSNVPLIDYLRNTYSDELKKIKGELEKRINSLKVSDFKSTVDGMQLELKVKKITEENEQLRHECEENKRIKREFDEMTQNYNDAMRINAALEEKIKILESDAETEGEAFKEVCHENENLKDRLAIAERYILNQVVYS